MSAEVEAIIRRHAAPLEPLPTDTAARLEPLGDIRAALFDVYGTLIVSGSGDVGLTSKSDRWAAANEAAAAVGVAPPEDPRKLGDTLLAAIEAEHARLRADGVRHPEVRIEELWEGVVPEADSRQLAAEYEMRINPVWPMPGMVETLDALRASDFRLGIVSNAQFFTPLLFGPLTGRPFGDFGFEPDLCVWSYGHRCAKPGTDLYEKAAAALAKFDVTPAQTLYVGNDMRNDVWPASRVGFRTALFAGDARSLRLREDDPDVAGGRPDVVLTDLRQVLKVVSDRPG